MKHKTNISSMRSGFNPGCRIWEGQIVIWSTTWVSSGYANPSSRTPP